MLVEVSKGLTLSSAVLTAQPNAAFQTPEILDGSVFHIQVGGKSIVFVISIKNFDAKAVENLLMPKCLGIRNL
jgi:hypothetical protein